MRICLDLDGVICQLKQQGECYSDLKPVLNAVEKVKALKESGHYIIIYTARHMKTCKGNLPEVIAKIGKTTMDWLAEYEVPYDEIVFGKPWADVYIDDNAFRFIDWDQIDHDGGNLPLSKEKLASLNKKI